MKTIEPVRRVCPVCGKAYYGHPVTSRKDPSVSVCQDCGIRESLEYLGVEPEDRERVLRTIHGHNRAEVLEFPRR